MLDELGDFVKGDTDVGLGHRQHAIAVSRSWTFCPESAYERLEVAGSVP
jgi:hypothetical protein